MEIGWTTVFLSELGLGGAGILPLLIRKPAGQLNQKGSTPAPLGCLHENDWVSADSDSLMPSVELRAVCILQWLEGDTVAP